MHLPHRMNSWIPISKIFLATLLWLQVIVPATVVKAQQNESPLGITDITDLIKKRAFDKNDLIDLVTRLGIKFPLTAVDERNIRLAGSYLKPPELDAVVASVRDNYMLAPIKKPLALRIGKPSQIEHLGFKATYIKKIGDDYLLNIAHPGTAQGVELKTRHDCEHVFKWGHREFTVGVIGVSPTEVNVVLANKIKPPTRERGSGSAYTHPAEIVIRDSPCLPVRMRLVTGNHIGVAKRLVNPYYISEPLTIGMLRYYAGIHTPMTTIPVGAKDTDPITEIYYDDALDIATMLGTRLPSLEEWTNAFHGGLVTPKPNTAAELVSEEGAFLAVRMADTNSPANTHLSSQIHTQKGNVPGPAKGYLRIVRPIKNPNMPSRIKIEPKKQGRP